MEERRNKKLNLILNILLVLGMLISLFLLYEHFAVGSSKFCTFGANLDCGIVNKSPYANIDGISYLLTIDYGLPIPLVTISDVNLFFDILTANAFLGFLTLLFVFLLNQNYKKKKWLWIEQNKNLKWIRGILMFGLIYGIYLIYIQHSVLKTYCIFCLSLDIIILSLVIVSRLIKK